MTADRRAVVHQFVHELGISSKSRGDGGSRFTVLSKTSRTRHYDEEEFDELLTSNRYRRRLATTTYIPSKGPKARPVVSYKDGETVGASAPELGPDNRGRAMLEKMGWRSGTALGAEDNTRGLLHPIAHTIKTNKAGLK